MARRRNQGGPSLLIPMIIIGFAWIGMIGLAYYLHSEIYANDEGGKQGIVFKLYDAEKDLKEYQVLVDSADLEHAKMTELVGFNAGNEIADSEAISFKTQEMKSHKYDIYEANYNQPMDWGSDEQQTYPFKIEKDFKSGNLTVTPYFPYADFTGEENPKLKDMILAQDDFINKVLVANNKLYNAILGLIQDYNKAYRAEIQAIAAEQRKTNERIDEKDSELDSKAEQDDLATEARDSQLDELIRTYNELLQVRANIAEIKRQIESDMKEQDKLELAVAEAREKLENIIRNSQSTLTQKNEYDGTIFYVSKRDRWAYINLGSKDRIQDNMTFNIIRYMNDGTHQRVGILQVKKVLSERASQCVITNIVNEKLFPERGDKILSSNYTNGSIKSIGFLGYFGGEFSKYTREQMKNQLEKQGFRVDDVIQPDTQVLILGFDYESDPFYKYIFVAPPSVSPGEVISEYHKLYDVRNTFEFLRPEEVEHMLGLNK